MGHVAQREVDINGVVEHPFPHVLLEDNTSSF